jgi:ribosomal protein S12 methylthiotransferase accessory factor
VNQANSKGKDAAPLDTINKIRAILGKLGLLTVESVWQNSVAGFYSVTVTLMGPRWPPTARG